MFNFPRQKRLLKKSEFEEVFNQGKKMTSEHFIFFYKVNTLTHARLGLAISKKKIHKAHDRNRVKRLIRETFRCHALAHVDIVVIARQAIREETNPYLMSQLGRIWDSLMTV